MLDRRRPAKAGTKFIDADEILAEISFLEISIDSIHNEMDRLEELSAYYQECLRKQYYLYTNLHLKKETKNGS